LKINEEETRLLWDLYHPKEEEGLSVFKSSLTNQITEFQNLNESKDLQKMTELIDETNRKMKMKYKREHSYNLEQYEERLYKEVIYDTRGGNIPSQQEEFRAVNPLKKTNKGGTRIRNINKAASEA
jgi:hypothetical protein